MLGKARVYGDRSMIRRRRTNDEKEEEEICGRMVLQRSNSTQGKS